MAASATDVLSVADAKAQLRIDGEDANALVQDLIEQAVAYVSEAARLPLIDRAETLRPRPPYSKSSPMVLPVRFVKAVTEFQYWSLASQYEREAPGETIDVSELRIDARETGRTLLWRATDWPDMQAFRPQVTVTRGYDIPARGSPVRSALILTVRALAEGRPLLGDSIRALINVATP